MSSPFSRNKKIVVLTEGKTDAEFLSETLKLLYPHLADYYGFMDFDGMSVAGGTSDLTKQVKAFAGAGIVNRVIAVFDNDTAGSEQVNHLKTISLPSNISVVQLPDIEELKSYPTIGPTNKANLDVNGSAASIELYLGGDVLDDGCGEKLPVQWTGYNAKMRRYQGEVIDKNKIQKCFQIRLNSCKDDKARIVHEDWRGLKSVLHALQTAFHEADQKHTCARIEHWKADDDDVEESH